MKKIILFSAVTCSVAFYACKKDINNVTETLPPVIDTTYVNNSPKPAIDPVELSAGLSIRYGKNISGTMPVATGTGAPVMVTTGFENITYNAIQNRYVIIYPKTEGANPKGYYLTVNGSGSYFKIEYPAASAGRAKNKLQVGLRDDQDFIPTDSAIVIKLPAGLKTDTFSVTYAAYDAADKVSNAINAVVRVYASKPADDALLKGTWKVSARKTGNGAWKPETFPLDTFYNRYSCYNDKLIFCGNESCPYFYLAFVTGTTNELHIFGDNGGYNETRDYFYKEIDIDNTVCGEEPKYKESTSSATMKGGYAYNDSSKIVTIVYDYDGQDGGWVSVRYADQYTVIERSASKIIIAYNIQYSDARSNHRDPDVNINYVELTKQ